MTFWGDKQNFGDSGKGGIFMQIAIVFVVVLFGIVEGQ